MDSKEIKNIITNHDADMNALLQIVYVINLRHELEQMPDLDSEDPAVIKEGRQWKHRIAALQMLITNPKLIKRAWRECARVNWSY